MHYWTAHSQPVALVKDLHVFYTYVTHHQIHVDVICFIIYYYSPTCFGPFCDHQQGVLQEYKQYIVFLYFISLHLLVCYMGIKLSLTHYMEHINSHVYFTELQ